jgi:hypothetical protein
VSSANSGQARAGRSARKTDRPRKLILRLETRTTQRSSLRDSASGTLGLQPLIADQAIGTKEGFLMNRRRCVQTIAVSASAAAAQVEGSGTGVSTPTS